MSPPQQTPPPRVIAPSRVTHWYCPTCGRERFPAWDEDPTAECYGEWRTNTGLSDHSPVPFVSATYILADGPASHTEGDRATATHGAHCVFGGCLPDCHCWCHRPSIDPLWSRLFAWAKSHGYSAGLAVDEVTGEVLACVGHARGRGHISNSAINRCADQLANEYGWKDDRE